MLVHYSKRASNTPAFALLAEGWNELVQDGFTAEGDGSPPLRPDDEVLYVHGDSEDDVIGVLAFDHTLALTVRMVYVEPSSRRRGVFKALLADLQEVGRTRGVERIHMPAPVENVLFQAVLKHMGGPTIAVVYDMATQG